METNLNSQEAVARLILSQAAYWDIKVAERSTPQLFVVSQLLHAFGAAAKLYTVVCDVNLIILSSSCLYLCIRCVETFSPVSDQAHTHVMSSTPLAQTPKVLKA
jgi:hypothetical protein